ncbi:hypothetical protein PINS_up019082 [Pythium insidiosum]|nr:hypothetical protein PINS_up019082 [Pythium insidiosum]
MGLLKGGRGARADEKQPLLGVVSATAPSTRSAGLGDRCPSDFKGFGASVLFTWINPLMRLGYERPLEHNDLYQLDSDNERATSARSSSATGKRRPPAVRTPETHMGARANVRWPSAARRRTQVCA